MNTPVTVNLLAIPQVKARLPHGCTPVEVAPGVYAHIDCRKYQPIAHAKQAHPEIKANLFKAGSLRLDPPNATSAETGAPATPTQGEPPASVDHRAQGIEGPVKDQGVVGACTAFSLSTMMDNAIRRLNKNDAISSLHLWAHYGEGEMSAAGSANLERLIAVWPDYPYNQGVACRMEKEDDGCGELVSPSVKINSAGGDPTIAAEVRGADGKGRYKITEIDRIHPIDPNALATILATGKDIWVGFGVSMAAWGSSAVQTSHVIPEYTAEEGGHAVVLAGYRTTATGREFLVHNSWSANWGDKGYAWVSEATVKAHAQAAYTIAVADTTLPPPPKTPIPASSGACPSGHFHSPALDLCEKECKTNSDCGSGSTCLSIDPAPAPTVCVALNPLTDDDCGEDALVDAVTGLCAPACPDGNRSAEGLCDAASARYRH